jgi:hypothetical protein
MTCWIETLHGSWGCMSLSFHVIELLKASTIEYNERYSENFLITLCTLVSYWIFSHTDEDHRGRNDKTLLIVFERKKIRESEFHVLGERRFCSAKAALSNDMFLFFRTPLSRLRKGREEPDTNFKSILRSYLERGSRDEKRTRKSDTRWHRSPVTQISVNDELRLQIYAQRWAQDPNIFRPKWSAKMMRQNPSGFIRFGETSCSRGRRPVGTLSYRGWVFTGRGFQSIIWRVSNDAYPTQITNAKKDWVYQKVSGNLL